MGIPIVRQSVEASLIESRIEPSAIAGQLDRGELRIIASRTGHIGVVDQDRRGTGHHIVRVACGRSLPAFSLASGHITVHRGAPMCAGVRGWCRHYCRQRSSPLGKSEPPRCLSID